LVLDARAALRSSSSQFKGTFWLALPAPPLPPPFPASPPLSWVDLAPSLSGSYSRGPGGVLYFAFDRASCRLRGVARWATRSSAPPHASVPRAASTSMDGGRSRHARTQRPFDSFFS
jgi:hypothetical protein